MYVDNAITPSKPAFHAIMRLKRSGLSPPNLVLLYKAYGDLYLSHNVPSWCSYKSANNKTKLS